jgi:hypothetical protein
MVKCRPMLVDHCLDSGLKRRPSLLDSESKTDKLFVQRCMTGIKFE